MWIGIGCFVFSDIATEHHYGIILKLTAAWRNGKQQENQVSRWLFVTKWWSKWRHTKCKIYTRDIILAIRFQAFRRHSCNGHFEITIKKFIPNNDSAQTTIFNNILNTVYDSKRRWFELIQNYTEILFSLKFCMS